jgi:hypothetical protein
VLPILDLSRSFDERHEVVTGQRLTTVTIAVTVRGSGLALRRSLVVRVHGPGPPFSSCESLRRAATGQFIDELI